MRRIILIIGMFACLFTTKAEELRFEHYSDETGLSHNSIRSILQDPYGFIWLGTFGGVNRFNGYNFKLYANKLNDTNYLQDNDITQMVIEGDENIWIGTSNGLTRFNISTSTFKTFHPDSTCSKNLVGNKIRSLCVDDQKRVWIGTKQNGVCFYDQDKNEFVRVEIEDLKYVRSIFQSKNKTIWLGTFGQGLYSFKLDENDGIVNLRHYDLKYKLNDDVLIPDVFFIYEDHKFDLFVGTKNGLFKKNKFKDEFELLEQKNNNCDFFRCIVQGPNGKYWLGTLNGMLICSALEDISTNKYERHVTNLSNPVSLINNYVTSLFFDKSGVLWIGTENGLDKYDPFDNQFKTIRGQSLAKDVSLIISSYGKTFDGNLLIGTHSNGLHLLKENKLTPITSKELKIASIYSPDNKEFYCGLWDGRILIYNYVTSQKEIVDVGIKDSPVFSLLKLSSSKLLIGSHSEGVYEYDFPSKKHVKFKPEATGLNGINKIIQAKSHIIWFGTQSGVFKYNLNSNKLTNYRSVEGSNKGLSNNEVKDVIIDKDGTLWAGTRHGLNYYDPEIDDFVRIDHSNDLKDVWITDMLVDSLGKIWLNINYNKIANYDPRDKELKFYLVKNGMRSTIYNKRGFLYYDHSKIYMGGESGIIYFTPSGIYENNYSPKPVIDKLMVHNKEVLCGEKINGQVILTEDFNHAKKVELEYKNRDFSISFSSSSYVNEKLNRFQYKLDGYDNEWNAAASDQRSVQYTNLKPGAYTFHLKARNNNGYWSDETQYQINILYPFWLSYKAIIIYIILFSFLIYQIRRIIIFRVNIKRELLFEKIKREKDEKLNEEKLRFFTNISHELKTPLTLILGPAQQLLEIDKSNNDLNKKYKLIYSNASRLLGLVNQIIDFRKVEQGKMKLKVSSVEIVSYTFELFEAFQLMADGKKLNYSFECKHDIINGWIDISKYERVIFNLLSNAFKYTFHGKIVISLMLVEEEISFIEVTVADTGVGIPKNKQEDLFNRFTQVDEKLKYNTGSGIGLSLVKSMVEMHHGKVWLDSESDKGSTFYVRFPISKNAYKKEELFECQTQKIGIETVNQKVTDVKLPSLEKQQKILVIEDSIELRQFIVDIISDDYLTYEASDGQEGIELAHKVKPDLVISDVMMERMDGFEFCKQLKEDDEISHIPVILLTALSEIEDQKKAFKIGADAYISKPFDPSLLKVRIEKMLDCRKKLKDRYLSEPDMEMSQLAHSVVDDTFVQNICTYIQENMSNPKFNKELICSEFNISNSKLYRKVKELTDVSPNELIRAIRLKQAFKLLRNGVNNVSEVAYDVGFSDPLYFSRCFSKQFGYPPSKINKNLVH